MKKQDKIYNNYTEASPRAYLKKNHKKLKLTTDSLLSSCFWQSLLSKLIKFKSQSKYKIDIVKEVSIDANTVLTEYYRHTLSEWAAKEWDKVCNIYGKGGLEKLFQTTYERLKPFPYLNIESSDWEPSRYSAIETAPFPTIIILLFVIYFLLKALFQTYEKHNVAEMKKAEVKLKDEIVQFYSGLIEYLTDKIRLEILSAIEIKEQWMDENFKDYKQLLDQKNEAAERNQPLSKKRIEQQKEYLKNLKLELGNIQRMQRNLG